MFTLPYRYLCVLLLATFCYAITVFCQVYYYFSIRVDGWVAFAVMLLITLVAWEVPRLLQPVLQQIPFLQRKMWFLVALYALGGLVTGGTAVLLVYCFGKLMYGYLPGQFFNPIKLNIIYASLVNLGLHLINAIFVYFAAYKKHWMEAEELRRVTAQAQVQLMRSQIKPHFLFNNLNVLAGMVMKDNPEANRFIEEFSKVYRYILNNHEKEAVPLQQELDFIEPYVFLLKKRFSQGIEITVDVPERYYTQYIIPAALQMLIENAIKHNVASFERPLHITVRADADDKLLVRNNRQPRTTLEASHRIGLQNIKKRYELICERPVHVRHTDDEFEVILPLLTVYDHV